MKQRYQLLFFIMAAVMTILLPAYSQKILDADTSTRVKAELAIKDYFKSIDANCPYAEFTSDLLRKHLPDCRVYVRTDQHISDRSTTFLVDKQGRVIDLGEGSLKRDTAAEYDRVHRLTEFSRLYKTKAKNPKEADQVARLVEEILAERPRVVSVSEFMQSQNINVKGREDAIEVSRLAEDISGAYDYINFLKMNTKDYSIFDKGFLEIAFNPRADWKYYAETTRNGWIVKRVYVGPPACTMVPPVYEVEVDSNHVLIDIHERPSILERMMLK
jgi:hypothetical protein